MTSKQTQHGCIGAAVLALLLLGSTRAGAFPIIETYGSSFATQVDITLPDYYFTIQSIRSTLDTSPVGTSPLPAGPNTPYVQFNVLFTATQNTGGLPIPSNLGDFLGNLAGRIEIDTGQGTGAGNSILDHAGLGGPSGFLPNF
jgi:hypothetical protein